MNKTVFAVTLLIVTGALIAYWIQLNNNRYYISSPSSDKGIAYEIDRKTGQTWVLIGYKKAPHEKDRKEGSQLSSLPQLEKIKIRTDASLNSGLFSGEVYNGSSWVVNEVVFHLVARNQDGGVLWARDYKSFIYLEPLTAKHFFVIVIGAENVKKYWSHIKDAKGYLE